MNFLITIVLGLNGFLFLDTPIEVKEDFFVDVFYTEKMPLFEGCDLDTLSQKEKQKCSEEALVKFIYSNFKYSSSMDCYSGRFLIRWKIEADGEITNIETLRPSIKSIEEEARRVVQMMPCWTPGEQNGKPVAVSYTFPFRFELSCK